MEKSKQKDEKYIEICEKAKKIVEEDEIWWMFCRSSGNKVEIKEKKPEDHSNFTCQKPNLRREENEELWTRSKVEIKGE